jgi:hypothetical protein
MTQEYQERPGDVDINGVMEDYDLYRRSRSNSNGWSCSCGLADSVPALVGEIRRLRKQLMEAKK